MAQERLEEVRQARLQKRAAVLEAGRLPYPAEAQRTHTISAIKGSFADLEDSGDPLTVVGRIMALRKHGGLNFADLQDESGTIQLQISRDDLPEDVFSRLNWLDIGDFIQVAGTAITTKTGVESIAVGEFHLLAKSVRPLPSTWFGLKDHEERFRNREVDLLLNDEARKALVMRSRVITWLRNFLVEDGYLEVETPTLQPLPGGAAARPFVTHHNTLDQDFYLRISSEMYLKRLVVAGFEKVFEITPRFRNEGIDRQHNPEFTMLEAQWTYADYEDLMDKMEEALSKLCFAMHESHDITWQGENLSFKAPFARVRYVDLMSEKLGVDILEEKDIAVYRSLLEQHDLDIPEAENYYQYVDELFKELVRPTLVQPTFVYDYPTEMIPLAKRSAKDERIAEMFQLLIVGAEVSKSYTELNDPVLQRQLLEEQQKQLEAGDAEAQPLDEEYLRAMEQGMPPNVGWGIGIDRLVMLLADVPHIRDTIAFPLMRKKEG